MVRSIGVPSSVLRRDLASQICREIGAIRSSAEPILESTFMSMVLPSCILPSAISQLQVMPAHGPEGDKGGAANPPGALGRSLVAGAGARHSPPTCQLPGPDPS